MLTTSGKQTRIEEKQTEAGIITLMTVYSENRILKI